MRSLALGVGCLSALAWVSAARAGVPYQRLFLSGDSISGDAPGMTLGDNVYSVHINTSGQLLVRADVKDANGVNKGAGVLTGEAGQPLIEVARNGAPAAGGGSYSLASVTSFEYAAMNDAGQIAFQGNATGVGPIGRGSLWLYQPSGTLAPGTTSLVAYDGEAIAGTTTYLSGIKTPSIGVSGMVSFGAAPAPSSTSWQQGWGPVPTAFFTTTGGSITQLVQTGYSVGNKTLNQIMGDGINTLDDDGSVRFSADLVSGSTHTTALVSVQAGSAATSLVSTGDAAPGLVGLQFQDISSSHFLADGRASFVAIAMNPTDTVINRAEWIRSASGVLLRVLGSGDSIPGSQFVVDGIEYAPVPTAKGRMAIVAEDSAANGAVLAGEAGDLRLLARDGDPAPGADGFTFANQFIADTSDSGVTAFSGYLSPAINSTLPWGLWIADPAGNVRMIARQGLPFDVDPGPGSDLRTVNKVLLKSVTDSGEVLFGLTFADGSSGYFFASAVPEPATSSLLMALAGAIALRRKARRAGAEQISGGSSF